ncbi:hypothetical protein ACFSYC_07655 [Mucilaginibacter antarcticus]|uniref:Uncharacterized protein n=2 Tax=Mucilaginibacter antarcticus TaxID=1855725 RepID=A0ABW5XLH9_9SPHI
MAGCNPQPVVNAIQVKYADNHAVTITGIDAAILNDIDRDSVKNWQSLLAIYRMPADTDMKDYQPIQPGKYLVKDGGLVFTPDTAFTAQQVYFARFYNYSGNKTLWQYIKGNTSKGQLHYTDLIFKP